MFKFTSRKAIAAFLCVISVSTTGCNGGGNPVTGTGDTTGGEPKKCTDIKTCCPDEKFLGPGDSYTIVDGMCMIIGPGLPRKGFP